MTACLLLASTRAGSTDADAVEAARAAMAAAGADVELVTTGTPEELDAALSVVAGRRLVVAGGDGSLHVVVTRLHARGELDQDLALVPLGTGNDLARALGLPLEPGPAGTLAATGQPRALDLLLDDAGGVAVNAVHLGIGAEAAQASAAVKPRLGPLAYPLGALVAGVRSRGHRLRVEVDGTLLHDGRALMVGIANGPGIGGGTALVPGALPDDGLLDVLVSTAVGPLARVSYGAAMRRGTQRRSPHVRTARGVSVTVSGGPAPVNADGEIGEQVVRRTWQVVPAAWRLVRP